MLRPIIYTPRTSFESTRTPTGFLSLPAELRIRIYEYCLANIMSWPLVIKRCPGSTWRYRRPKSPNIPAILILNKQIYFEARDILHKLCFSTSNQPVVIQHIQPNQSYGCRPQTEPKDWNNICTYGSVREVAPVLRSLPRIRLEVGVSGSYEEQALTIALLKWIRAVLSSRPSFYVPLYSFDVIFGVPHNIGSSCYYPKQGDGLVQAITGIKTVVRETEVWYSWASRRPVNRNSVKVEAGRRLEISDVSGGVEESEESAWKGLEKAWKRTKASKTMERHWSNMSWGSSISEMSRRLVGR